MVILEKLLIVVTETKGRRSYSIPELATINDGACLSYDLQFYFLSGAENRAQGLKQTAPDTLPSMGPHLQL